jgi:hypothetical protein
MSRHHIMPPAIYTPPPPKKIEKKRRIGIGRFSELDETDEAREAGEAGPPAPIAGSLLQQNFAEIEGAERKPRHPQGRLSQGTLSALLRVQELK